MQIVANETLLSPDNEQDHIPIQSECFQANRLKPQLETLVDVSDVIQVNFLGETQRVDISDVI